MFSLEKHEASISNLNTRIERHGEDRELSVDIKFALNVGNYALDMIEPGLRESLFKPASKGQQLSLTEGADALVAVRHPCLEPVSLSHKFPGYEVRIAGMLEASDELFLVDVELKKFVLKPIEGGSVAVTLTASANVDADELRDLGEALIREDVLLSLTPPTRAANDDPDDEAADDAGDGEAQAA